MAQQEPGSPADLDWVIRARQNPLKGHSAQVTQVLSDYLPGEPCVSRSLDDSIRSLSSSPACVRPPPGGPVRAHRRSERAGVLEAPSFRPSHRSSGAYWRETPVLLAASVVALAAALVSNLYNVENLLHPRGWGVPPEHALTVNAAFTALVSSSARCSSAWSKYAGGESD